MTVPAPSLPVLARAFVDIQGNNLLEIKTGDFDDPSVAPGQISYIHLRFCPVRACPKPKQIDDKDGKHDYDSEKSQTHDYYDKYDNDHGSDYDASYDSVARANGIKQFSANFHYTWPSTEPSADKDYDDDDQADSWPQFTIKNWKIVPVGVQWDRLNSRKAIRQGGYSALKLSGMPESTSVELRIRYRMLNPNYVPPKPSTKSSNSKGNNDDDHSGNSDDDHRYNPQYLYRTVEFCVPIKKAPNPTLTGAGYLGLSGPDFAFANKPVTYNIFVSDPIGTANVSGICNLYVQSVISTTPVRVLSPPVLIGTGPVTVTQLGGGYCTFNYAFPAGGAYVISASLTNILPIDYDPTDNTGFINVNVSGPTGTGGGGTGGGGGPEAVVASFSALGTVETVNIPNGPVTLVASTDPTVKTTATPAYNIGDDVPSQGVNVKVTLLKQLDGPFDVSASLDTQGNRLGGFTVTTLALDPTVTRKSPGNVALSPGDICTRSTVVDNPEGYLAQVCVNTISTQTVYYFNAHANFDGNVGHFVPYGTQLSFSSDLVSGGKHYRIPTQTFSLSTANGVPTPCTRPATGPVLATCSYSSNTTTRAGNDAQRSNIIIYGTAN